MLAPWLMGDVCGNGADMETRAARKRAALDREVSRVAVPGRLPRVARVDSQSSPLLRVIGMPILLGGRHWFQVVLGLLAAKDLRALSVVCRALSRRNDKAVDAWLLCWECIEYEQHQDKLAEQAELETELLHDVWDQEEKAWRRARDKERQENDIISYNLGILSVEQYFAVWGQKPPIQDVHPNRV